MSDLTFVEITPHHQVSVCGRYEIVERVTDAPRFVVHFDRRPIDRTHTLAGAKRSAQCYHRAQANKEAE